MKNEARGTFEANMHPEPPHDTSDGIALARVSIDKVFKGDLQGTSVVDMLSAGGSVKGSAGYVAMERVHGILHGKRGSFVLQHVGVMDRGAGTLTVVVVPDTGTGELTGLTGTFSIEVEGGEHRYAFSYAMRG